MGRNNVKSLVRLVFFIFKTRGLSLVLLLPFLSLPEGRADCTGPSATEGAIEYFTSTNQSMYCDGTDWKPLKSEGLQMLGNLTDPDAIIQSPSRVAVSGNYVYVYDSSDSTLNIMDITDKSNPNIIAEANIGYSISAMKAEGAYVYVTGGTNFTIFDVSVPASPNLVTTISGSGYISSPVEIEVVGNYAYFISRGLDQFAIADISNKSSPSFIGTLQDSVALNEMNLFTIDGNYAYIASTDRRFIVINITNKSAPSLEASLYDATNFVNLQDVGVSSSYAFLAVNGSGSSDGELVTVDISDPANPTIANIMDLQEAYRIEIHGTYAYVGTYLNGESLKSIDISQPLNPKIIHSIPVVEGSGLMYLDSDPSTFVGIAGSTIYLYDITPKSMLTGSPDYSLRDGNINGLASIGVAGSIAVGVTSSEEILTFDVSDPNNVVALAYLDLPTDFNQYASDIVFDGTYAYTSHVNWSGIHVIDVSNPAAPFVETFFQAAGLSQSYCLEKSGNYIYSATGSGLFITDVTDPTNPSLAGSLTTGFSGPRSVAVSGNYAYVANYYSDTLTVVDISNPASPTIAGSVIDSTQLDMPQGVVVSGNYAFVAARYYLTVVDISTPTAPVIVGTLNSTSVGTGNNMKVSGNLLYINGGFSTGTSIVDISTPTSPTFVRTGISWGHYGLDVAGTVMYTSSSSGSTPFLTWNVSTPSSPALMDQAGYTGSLEYPQNVVGSGNYAFVSVRGTKSVNVYDFSTPTSPSLVAVHTESSRFTNLGRIEIAGNYLYAPAPGYLTILDISNPASPSFVGALNNGTQLPSPYSVKVSGNYAYVNSSDRLTVVNVSNPASPSFVYALTHASLVNCSNIEIKTSYLYLVCDGSDSFIVVDISTPTSPSVVAVLSNSQYFNSPNGLTLVGNYAYTSGSAGLGGAIVDISTPTSPVAVKQLFPYNVSSTSPDGVFSFNGKLYMSHGVNFHFAEKSLADPVNPSLIGTAYASITYASPSAAAVVNGAMIGIAPGYDLMDVWNMAPRPIAQSAGMSNTINRLGNPCEIAIEASKAYVLGNGHLTVVDITDTNNPAILGSLYDSRFVTSTCSMKVQSGYVYITNGNSDSSYFIGVVNASNPASMTFVSSGGNFQTSFQTSFSKIIGNYWYLSGYSRLKIWDISSPSAISQTDSISLSNAAGFDIIGTNAFVCRNSGMISVVDVSDPSNIVSVGDFTDAALGTCYDLAASGSHLIAVTSTGIFSVDASNPAALSTVDSLTGAGFSGFSRVAIHNDFAYVKNWGTLKLVDISNKSDIRVVDEATGFYGTPMAASGETILSPKFLSLQVVRAKPFTNLGPCSQAGEINFDVSQNVFAFCDGAKYTAIGTVPGAGGGGCSSPSAPIGSLEYDSSVKKFKYCDGGSWVTIN